MQTYQVGLISVGVFLLLVVFSYLSWQSKKGDQEKRLPKPIPLVTQENGYSAFYVTTVFEGTPSKRVLAHGLGFRGKAIVSVNGAGVGISRVGENSFLIPRASIVGIQRASSALDKAVENNGITLIDWQLGEQNLQTQLRFVSSDARIAFEDRLVEILGGVK